MAKPPLYLDIVIEVLLKWRMSGGTCSPSGSKGVAPFKKWGEPLHRNGGGILLLKPHQKS